MAIKLSSLKDLKVFIKDEWVNICCILTLAKLSKEMHLCKSQVHLIEDIRGSGDNLDCQRVELSTNVTLARSRWASNYYITPATGSSDQLERRCWNGNHVPAEPGPLGPQLSSPGEQERNATMARRVGVNMLQFYSVSNSPLTHNPFNKVRGIFFLRTVSACLYCVEYVSACICACIFAHGDATHFHKNTF